MSEYDFLPATTPGQDVVAAADASFEALRARGYEIFYDLHSGGRLSVEARLNSDVAGRAEFQAANGSAYCQNVEVEPAHQRRKIATAMYVFAERVLGAELEDFWGDEPDQTPAARALWAQPNRPFGPK